MSPCFIINARNERVVLIVQVLKDELRHKILLESEHLFLQRGYDRTSLQMIADKVNISKSNLYHYFKNKEELFYELTDSAADGLKRMILRFRSMRFDLNMDAQEFRMLLSPRRYSHCCWRRNTAFFLSWSRPTAPDMKTCGR